MRTGVGYLRMGMVINHKDLRIGYEKIWGGGWWARVFRATSWTPLAPGGYSIVME
ncbi:MAG: hypothetical protein PUA96_04865 [Bacteroidales bacterium]|nr:hypothetical protein [Bacteroidales bacterium]